MLPSSVSRHDSNRSRRDPTAPAKHIDPVLLVVVAALALVGIVAVYSATRGPGPAYSSSYLFKQAAFVGVGGGAFLLFSIIDYRKLHDWAWVFYGITTFMLILVISPLGSQSKGAQAWFALGPFQLQPAEFAKLSLIGALGFMLSEFRGDIDLRRLLSLLGVAALPMILILIQPDLGLVLILTAVALAMLLVGGLPTKYIVVLTLVGLFGIFGALNSPVLKEYQINRLTAFANPEDKTNPAVYNIDQSQQAIAAGTSRAYLPTDGYERHWTASLAHEDAASFW